MTVEVTPLGVACNLGCSYCYQAPMRNAGNEGAQEYDMAAMKRAILATGQSFTVFGGEPLLVPIVDLEELFRFGLQQYNIRKAANKKQRSGPNGIQTNGVLITDEHMALFKKYHVHVGFSLDGPGDLNNARWNGTLEKTQQATARSHAALERCLAEGVSASLILTVHRGNVGTPERMARIQEWLKDLDQRGLKSARIHALEIEFPDVKAELELTEKENIQVFLEFARFEKELKNVRFDVFRDITKALEGDTNVTCTWTSCDPYTTRAVQGIDGQGNKANCGRTNKDGIRWIKADRISTERQLALYNTPQELGGCQGCRFFIQCRGQCPGTSIDGDWRNKSKDCGLWMALLEFKERELCDKGVVPKSMAPNRLQREREFLAGEWSNPTGQATRRVAGNKTTHGDSDKHLDHTDNNKATHADHTDAEHPWHADSDGKVVVERVRRPK